MAEVEVNVKLKINKDCAERMGLMFGDVVVAESYENGGFCLGVDVERRDGAETELDVKSLAPEGIMESRKGRECRDMIHTLEAAGYSTETMKESVRRFWFGRPSLSDAFLE